MSVLLDYVFRVDSIVPTPEASTGFLKKVLAVVKPNGGGVTGTIYTCISNAQIEARTDNDDAKQLLAAGMSSIYLLTVAGLDEIADAIADNLNDFYTVLISSDFTDAEVNGTQAVAASRKFQDITYTAKTAGTAGNSITLVYTDTETGGDCTVGVVGSAITCEIESGVTTAATIKAAVDAFPAAAALVSVAVDAGDETDPQVAFSVLPLQNGVAGVAALMDLGEYNGVVGVNSDDANEAAANAIIEKRCGFYSITANKAENMFYAFGKLLSNSASWNNQQYVTMPKDDAIVALGTAELLFEDKVSFVITDAEQYGKRLALFACGGKAIAEPYITKNLELEMQSKALSYISGNQPQYTNKEAALLENALKDVIQLYIDREWIESGVVEVTLEAENFVASCDINISEPKALWRVYAELRQTL